MFSRHAASDSSKLHQFVSLIPFYVFRALFTEFCNCACAKKIVMLIKIRHTCVGLIQKKIVLSLETSSEINFGFIKFVKKCKMPPFDNVKYLVFFDSSRFSIPFFLLPNQINLSAHCSSHFSTSNVLRLRCNNTLRFQC